MNIANKEILIYPVRESCSPLVVFTHLKTRARLSMQNWRN